MKFDIFDFHTHPYVRDEDNICAHKAFNKMPYEKFGEKLRSVGISGYSGSVIKEDTDSPLSMIKSNDDALYLRDLSKGVYCPGFMVDARFVEESKKQIDRAVKEGVRLIGELVPYHYKWKYSDEGFSEILDYAEGKGLVFNLHTADELDAMEAVATAHKDTAFVFAHPGEISRLLKHIEIMKCCENVYLDLSGTGLFRHGMLKRLVCEVGADRILFGSDYPACNAGMYVLGVDFEDISEEDKRRIYSLNAKRLLRI